MKDCIFCKIIAKEIPSAIIYEDREYIAFLDINPVNKGHTLVIPKKHYANINELPDSFNASYMNIIKKIGRAVQESTGCEGYNLIFNTGKPAGQAVFHVHCHIIPRIEGDGFEHWSGNPYPTNEEMEQYKNRIKERIR
ncbi:MAG: HIT family protein [Candidatus Woesearchaeota archaeon]